MSWAPDGARELQLEISMITLINLMRYCGLALMPFTLGSGISLANVTAGYLDSQTDAGVADVDGNGVADALTDGLLVVRRLFGFSGVALTEGAVGGGCMRCDAAAIAAHIDQIHAALDVDGNGQSGALTDGLLLIRYLFGLSGEALTAEAVGPGCSRCTAAVISAYCATLTSPPAATVSLAWDPSPSVNVGGYYLHYKLDTANRYITKDDAGNKTTDTLSLWDNRYCFVVTAYDTTRTVESGHSNEVCVTVGSPTSLPLADFTASPSGGEVRR
jgi:hypothetical protein